MKLLTKEKKLWKRGFFSVGGGDEVGLGSWAGPITAAIVVVDSKILDLDCAYEIQDSKRLNRKKRAVLYDCIVEQCVAYGIGSIDNGELDEVGVKQAISLAFYKAYCELSFNSKLWCHSENGQNTPIDYLLLDGRFIFDIIPVKQEAVIKADTKFISVAAASIIAKHWRDTYMKEVCHKEFPMYGFDTNAGYGTAKHREAVEKYGICKYHRQSFKFGGRNGKTKKDEDR